jgi:hypothetical protein
MGQSTTVEVANCAATQELPSILHNGKVHYSIHKSPPPAPILNQTNPVHIPLACLLKFHINIIHPITSPSSEWCLSFRLSHYHVRFSPTPFVLYSPPIMYFLGALKSIKLKSRVSMAHTAWEKLNLRHICCCCVGFEVFTAVTTKNGVFWMLRRVALARTDVSEELSASFIKVTRMWELGTTPSIVPSSPILVTLMKEALSSSQTSVP